MKQLLIFFLILFHNFLSLGQDKNDLLKDVDTTKHVSKKVQLLTDLAWEYTLSENDSSLVFSNRALELSKEKSYPLGEAISLESIGLYYEITEGDFEKASKKYFKALELCEMNNLEYLAEVLHTIGIMFHSSDNYTKAREYYEKAYEKALKNDDLSLQKKALANLGAVYSSLEEYDKAEETMLKSLDLKIHPEMNYNIYANLGYYYVKSKDFKKALPFLEKATEQHPDNFESEVNLYHLIHAKVMANDISNMDDEIHRAEIAAENVSSIRDRSLLLRNIADYYELKGDYKKAVNFRNKYIEVYEEIKEKQRDDIVHELETKYETDKKDAALKVLKLETEKKEQKNKLLFALVIAGLLIAAILGYFGYKNRNKNIKLAKQKALLEKTVDEKNILLKETHHRVKNSFQIVSSLLYLQSENVEDKSAKSAIKEAENRVRSMVLVHQKLYNKDELVGINSEEYISDLVKDIFESHDLEKNAISYNLNIEPLVLNIETITPLGLIINELIINTFKHAFIGIQNNNAINIDFSKVNDRLVLKVTDNGKGFEGNIKQTSFGITLMKALSKQLKATLKYESESNTGTTAVLNITKFKILS